MALQRFNISPGGPEIQCHGLTFAPFIYPSLNIVRLALQLLQNILLLMGRDRRSCDFRGISETLQGGRREGEFFTAQEGISVVLIVTLKNLFAPLLERFNGAFHWITNAS